MTSTRPVSYDDLTERQKTLVLFAQFTHQARESFLANDGHHPAPAKGARGARRQAKKDRRAANLRRARRITLCSFAEQERNPQRKRKGKTA